MYHVNQNVIHVFQLYLQLKTVKKENSIINKTIFAIINIKN